MLILAIESSCDETAAAVVKDGRTVLSSVVASQIEKHKIYGGVVPEIASRCHSKAIVGVVDQALTDACVTLKDINAIAVTYAPGLIGSLLVGVNFAKGLSLATRLPLVPVHHIRSHIAANYITSAKLTPPFLCLVVSGGHTNIIEVKDYTKFHIIGKTRDDAAGEAFDKAARTMGMPYPGGIQLDKIAETGNENAFVLPKPQVAGSKYDFSFSGLKTSVINKIHNANQKNEAVHIEDLSASFRKTAVEYLIENFFKAATDYNYKTLAAAGGVCANSFLRKRLAEECNNRNWNLYVPELSLCGDNAAMVGAQGYYEFLSGNIAGLDLNAYATKEI
ncbi:MAG: tRNA (adenosine(37)-N6)-threonylcarbamoyltransferase complex transferase subunit TsaD [Eubacteriales bacterium SKADARSKE-1]|nr:tRNA (adenosine(37)-N6)-threonylcarbamoyltransferase complex transferase subunit TsaD [Eubacteriales bacterium SKADARSKE-1]